MATISGARCLIVSSSLGRLTLRGKDHPVAVDSGDSETERLPGSYGE